jgi:membrane protease YdiL (CAAX protease family)
VRAILGRYAKLAAMSDAIPPRPDPFESRPSPAAPDSAVPAATWRPIEAIPVFVVAVILALLLGSIVVVLVKRCAPQFVLTTFVGELAFALAVLGWVRFVDHGPVAALGAPRRPLLDLGSGILTGAALVVIGGLVLAIDRAVAMRILGHAAEEPQQVVSCVRGAALAYLAPVVILVAPFGEELLFRGFLYKGLRRRLSSWPAAIISGLAFGSVHYAGLSFLLLIPALVVVGVGLAWVYERRQSVLASMVAHATFNLVGYLSIAMSRH